MGHLHRPVNVLDERNGVAEDDGAIASVLVHFNQIDKRLDFVWIDTVEELPRFLR